MTRREELYHLSLREKIQETKVQRPDRLQNVLAKERNDRSNPCQSRFLAAGRLDPLPVWR
jgi:septum formation topological specificity factor MinE